MSDINTLRQHRANPNVQKFLNMLAAAEGTTTHGYATAFGGGRIADLSRHPGTFRKFKETTGRTNTTSAAGRYQFIGKTWRTLQNRLGLPDFGAESQDLAAIELLRENGSLPFILKGDFHNAVKKSAKTWASLPTSPYAQKTRSWDFVNKHLGVAGLPSDAQTANIATQHLPQMPDGTASALSTLAASVQALAGLTQQAANTTQPENLKADLSLPQEDKIDVLKDAANTYKNFETPDLSDEVQPMDFDLHNAVNSSEPTSHSEWISNLQKSIETANYADMQNAAVHKMFGNFDPTPSFGTMPEGVTNFINELIGKA